MTKKDYIEFIEKNLWDFWFTIKKNGNKENFKELAQSIHEVLVVEYNHTNFSKIDDYIKNYNWEDSVK